MFFDWLDSKGEAAGQPLPNLDDCPRSQLDSDTVLYITNHDVQDKYKLEVRICDNGKSCIYDRHGHKVCTGQEGWIFVLRDQELYGAQKVTSITGKSKQRFHHSSFFGGKAVAAAGIVVTNEFGRLTRLYPHSGHYRPGEPHMQRMLYFLQQRGVELASFEVDTQQLFHVSRENKIVPKGGAVEVTKKSKMESLHLQTAATVANYLAHKALMLGNSVFGQLHKIRKMISPKVTEILEEVDEGGLWNRVRREFQG
eukprot:CAMPEP_0118722818 /NCGR_PEP_ID=MMETSP0800-20121206/31641_1 /TAXON_ID=210618 ORGANISM="Striatella unipunctata, Strain CCMP2910" /NCGR_SAMPLE_ID=MMETSP0800 /ASSEMBLY_ACC=CAM_ASM_000638 /LENGTH=253 /DNA_ID=CAMNT_0006631139 /DNA_START=181 /DNA_END=942 /DNA_ORIENTATION=+